MFTKQTAFESLKYSKQCVKQRNPYSHIQPFPVPVPYFPQKKSCLKNGNVQSDVPATLQGECQGKQERCWDHIMSKMNRMMHTAIA